MDNLDKSFIDKLVISEENYWLSIWRFIIAIFSLASTLTAIYNATYSLRPIDFQHFYEDIEKNIVNIVIEGFFLIDIFVNCLIEYRDVDNRRVQKVSKIVWQYFITTFIFDFLAIIPFTAFHHHRSDEIGKF